MDQHLAADGEADPADPLGIDVGTAAEIRRGGVKISLAVPAEGVRIALARALAAAVEEQDAVAVADEHARVLLRPGASGERDHGGAVPRRHEPALEPEPVARREGDVLVSGAEVRSRHFGPRGVRDDVGDRGREEHLRDEDEHAERDRGAPKVPAQTPVVGAARAPERHGPDAEEHEPGEHRQEAGEVVAGRPAVQRVVHGLGAAEDAEEAGEERQRRAHSGPGPPVQGRGACEERQGHEAADEVVGHRGARLGLQEAVVDDVQRDERPARPSPALARWRRGPTPRCGPAR